jgi:hypothetical protein
VTVTSLPGGNLTHTRPMEAVDDEEAALNFFDNMLGGEANAAGTSSSFASNKGGEENEAEAKTQWKNIDVLILTTKPKEVLHQQRVEVVLQGMPHRGPSGTLDLCQHVADHQTGLHKHLQ